MKTVKFRPLRRVKKTGKIVVASYMGWRNVRTADYNKFELIVDDEYKRLPPEEYVYTHEGKLIYFFDYNPADIPIYDSTAERLLDENWLDKLHDSKKGFGIIWGDIGFSSSWVHYNCKGMDCEGVPSFSHWDEDRVASEDTWNYYGADQFHPLTVAMVVKWIGWFLYQFKNSYLQIGK